MHASRPPRAFTHMHHPVIGSSLSSAPSLPPPAMRDTNHVVDSHAQDRTPPSTKCSTTSSGARRRGPRSPSALCPAPACVSGAPITPFCLRMSACSFVSTDRTTSDHNRPVTRQRHSSRGTRGTRTALPIFTCDHISRSVSSAGSMALPGAPIAALREMLSYSTYLYMCPSGRRDAAVADDAMRQRAPFSEALDLISESLVRANPHAPETCVRRFSQTRSGPRESSRKHKSQVLAVKTQLSSPVPVSHSHTGPYLRRSNTNTPWTT